MRRPVVFGALLTIAVLAVAVPVLAGVGNPNAPAQQKEKVPSAPITISGTLERSTDAEGDTTYTLTDGGTTYVLEAGPKWFFETYPLEPYVGQDVTVEGEIEEGSNVVDVHRIDGNVIREAGKPPWAGGWKVVGERHPGWSQEKADRIREKFGDCFPPGQCKDKPGRDKAGAGDDAGDETGDERSPVD
ncbi:MAG TPA: hypothetical protein VNL94_01165 [Candidatus Binatia bacterium]|nr:hypothetical protein [Candidatus Binatia bacterium]